jgi:hypothetical protein
MVARNFSKLLKDWLIGKMGATRPDRFQPKQRLSQSKALDNLSGLHTFDT